MTRANRNRQGTSSFELVEESVHLLRTIPARFLVSYYIGTFPFVLGLLYFWADMSRSPVANQHLPEAGLGLAALFLWMKTWQSIFARQLLDSLAGNTGRSGWRWFVQVLVAQATLQPSALLLVPLASIPLIPVGWVYAFYQNASVFGAGEDGSTHALVKRAARQARLWPKQNHALLSVLFGFGVFVFLNWATFVLLLPLALKTLLGIQSTFSLSPLTMLNSTFFAIVSGLTYLVVDPLIRSAYVLRCFYGEALESGADLKSELVLIKSTVPSMAVLVFMLVLLPVEGFCQPPASTPQSGPAIGESGSLTSQQLDEAISDVLQQRKYTWRTPREKVEPQPGNRGIIGRFMDRASDTVKEWLKSVANWLGRLLRKIFRQPSQGVPQPSGFAWMTRLHLLIYLLIAAALIAIILLARRLMRNRRLPAAPLEAEAIAPGVDLADENIGADHLPEDGWTRLAHELLERGELRLALRAFYLASLAHLSARHLLTIAGFKSNRDYEQELLRRAHSWPDLLFRFSNNVAVFDRVWYGMYPVDNTLINGFAANVEAIRASG